MRYVSNTANFDIAHQAKYVDCGSAESRTSAGFYISSSTGDNIVSSLKPNVSVLGSNQAFAAVDTVQDGSGYNSNWALKTTAVCATL